MAAAPTPAWLRSRVRSAGWAQRAEAEIASRPATPRQLRRRLRDLDTIARHYARRVGDPVVLRDLDRARVALEDRLARYGHLSEGHGELMAAPRRSTPTAARRAVRAPAQPRRPVAARRAARASAQPGRPAAQRVAARTPWSVLEPGRTRNRYPPFAKPRPEERALANAMAARLSAQTGLPIRADQILEAPSMLGAPAEARTSMGFRRNARGFFRVYRDQVPEGRLLGGGNVVTRSYARAMGWPDHTIGQPLEHHHIDHGPFTALLPATYHPEHGRGAHGQAPVHGAATVVATPADTRLPPLF